MQLFSLPLMAYPNLGANQLCDKKGQVLLQGPKQGAGIEFDRLAADRSQRVHRHWHDGAVLGGAARRIFGRFSPHLAECTAAREWSWFAMGEQMFSMTFAMLLVPKDVEVFAAFLVEETL
ncbi:hypothetical protein TIFTF001_012714 [Ficus carica]|uniref:Uncharacterized protein n=1 Tax=Ficus carica TaxID=3494 RepID=A0AA88D254_FICCA|nr:hypothetical protein TIFTF001_012714 [Ficus carica]